MSQYQKTKVHEIKEGEFKEASEDENEEKEKDVKKDPLHNTSTDGSELTSGSDLGFESSKLRRVEDLDRCKFCSGYHDIVEGRNVCNECYSTLSNMKSIMSYPKSGSNIKYLLTELFYLSKEDLNLTKDEIIKITQESLFESYLDPKHNDETDDDEEEEEDDDESEDESDDEKGESSTRLKIQIINYEDDEIKEEEEKEECTHSSQTLSKLHVCHALVYSDVRNVMYEVLKTNKYSTNGIKKEEMKNFLIDTYERLYGVVDFELNINERPKSSHETHPESSHNRNKGLVPVKIRKSSSCTQFCTIL